MKKYTHLILHGSYGSDSANWTPWLKDKLESQGAAVLAPQFPVENWDHVMSIGKTDFVPKIQTLQNWLSAFEELLPQLETKNLTIYAHSLAPLFMLHVLSIHPGIIIKNAYFVAPFLGKIGDNWPIEKVNESFYANEDLDYETLSGQIEKSVVFYSNNDPYVPELCSIEFAQKIHAQTVMVPGRGHFNTESSTDVLPELFLL
jgi:predicted alpha/beta hydrolase family esterase